MTTHRPRASLSNSTDQLRNVLESQARDMTSLADELSKSYAKEIRFLDGMMRRDKEIRELKAKNTALRKHQGAAKADRDQALKKIWWLETELNKYKEALATERERTQTLRDRLNALQGSPLGRVQRAYWKLRSRRR